MEPIHPADQDMKMALIPVILAWIFLAVTQYLGWWDAILVVVVEYFPPIWHWGG